MIVVLVGEEGAAALAELGDASEVHAIGFDPRGLTRRPVAHHTRPEAEVAMAVKADVVIGGSATIWGFPTAQDIPTTQRSVSPEEIQAIYAPKRRGRPPKVKD